MEEKVSTATETYRNLLSYPDVVSAHVLNNDTDKLCIKSKWSQNNLERAEKVNFTKSYFLKDNKVEYIGGATEINNELLWEQSPSGKYQAVIKKFKPKKGEDKQFLEIWDKDRQVKNFDLLSQEKHEKVYDDAQFSCLCWSASEKKILYVAEKKTPKTSSFFERKKKDEKKEEKETILKGAEHDFKQDWGEQLTGKHKSVLCILDVEKGDIEVLDGLPDNITPGQALWSPGDDGVVFVGWCHEPYRLGLIYCPIRQSSIYYWNIKTFSLKRLSDEKYSACMPRFSPDGTRLIYLENDVGGPHYQCSRMMMINWKSQELTTVVDIVKDPKDKEFPGLFTFSLPRRCWSVDSTRVALQSLSRCQSTLVIVNTEDRSLSYFKTDGGYQVMDVHQDLVLLAVSSINIPPYLCLVPFPSTSQQSLEGSVVSLDPPQTHLDIDYEILTFTPFDRPHPTYGARNYDAVYISPKNSTAKDLPLIVFPHGGPHSAFSTSYSVFTAQFALSGFVVLYVNYRGSVGYGDNSLRMLPGSVGDMDVKDCQCAAEHILKQGKADPSKVVVFGGSHGGFLTTHLIGQYPDFYKAACCRNPVTNIASMIGTTDIPDWCFVEAGLNFTQTSLADDKVLTAMWKKSPMQYVDKVKAPLLILLGMSDARVPPKQGEEYYKQLKARNVETRLIAYEDNNHPISKVDAQADTIINVLSWFWSHLP